jgi:hypothetical protein
MARVLALAAMRTATALLPLLLLLSACDREPAFRLRARKVEAVTALGGAFSRSVEAEKSAVLATTDEESRRFAEQSRQAAAEVDRLSAELGRLVAEEARPGEPELLKGFAATWAAVAAIDARLLPLAEANTNLKATQLSTHQAAAALEALVAALQALQAQVQDPGRLRGLSGALVAALTIQTLHAPHIASPSEPEMAALETRVGGLEKVVDGVLAGLPPGPARAAAREAWGAYRGHTAEVLRLSRENTNVRSFALSVHEKSDASAACGEALRALAAGVGAPGPWATR